MILRGSPDGDNPHGRFAQFTQPGLEIQNKPSRPAKKARAASSLSAKKRSFNTTACHACIMI